MSRSMDDLREPFKSKAKEWLAKCQAEGLDILVYCTLRTAAEQAELYAKGRTTPGPIVTYAKPGSSAHQYGLSLDFVPLSGGKPLWKGGDHWKRPIEIAESLGLESASRWLKFKEMPHIQLAGWRSYVN